ncbi:TIGR00266 family protein [Candidatus Woesearchaeota archaeon]|jgi:uncharacterized protein (TIGR00266 family)|nr:TIGR00266 family protein [Candidatus Woesearchaeota archaeon]MBT4388065.1 TIGR00266 family protein [Candidatus Woesearchaeota archaeon]MBT4596330.1 TIGR00266 family protein [Candidatus Woesearchaeota archaeon]MBT5740832.1 TIGR00266 family protein [Candidatus Woesearchaeota archaeon]MBT6505243.1 TIGR00266 family protein [Candidatus Woesearchaeota archaeon]
MIAKINGKLLQTVNFELHKNESIYAQTGSFSWMSDNIEMDTNAKGGFFKSLGRIFTGESFFLTTFRCTSSKGILTLSNRFPGKIIEINLKKGEELIIQKTAFLAATHGVELSLHFTKRFGAGLFGGEGFILQKVKGEGKIWLELSGEVSEIVLEKDQELKIDTSLIGIFEPSISYNVKFIKGFKNLLFGAEGLFFATLKGPGKMWLQSTTINNLAKELSRRITK